MSPTIPVFQLDALTESGEKPAVFFAGLGSAAVPHLPLDRPYRNDFYKIGLCLRGSARLQVYSSQSGLRLEEVKLEGK